jgi:hypothetical protein
VKKWFIPVALAFSLLASPVSAKETETERYLKNEVKSLEMRLDMTRRNLSENHYQWKSVVASRDKKIILLKNTTTRLKASVVQWKIKAHDLAKIKKENRYLKKQIHKQKEEAARLKEEISRLNDRISSLDAELAKLSAEYKEQVKRLNTKHRGEITVRDRQIDSLQAENAQKDERIEKILNVKHYVHDVLYFMSDTLKSAWDKADDIFFYPVKHHEHARTVGIILLVIAGVMAFMSKEYIIGAAVGLAGFFLSVVPLLSTMIISCLIALTTIILALHYLRLLIRYGPAAFAVIMAYVGGKLVYLDLRKSPDKDQDEDQEDEDQEDESKKESKSWRRFFKREKAS